MYLLNYHSVSRQGLGLENLDQILEESVARNSAKNISGCLIYHNNRFVQILEGNKKDVLKVYQKIKKDKRHHSVTLCGKTRWGPGTSMNGTWRSTAQEIKT